MTLLSIKQAIIWGMYVCFKTSRYEVIERDGELLARNVYDGTTETLTHCTAQQCFIKTGGV